MAGPSINIEEFVLPRSQIKMPLHIFQETTRQLEVCKDLEQVSRHIERQFGCHLDWETLRLLCQELVEPPLSGKLLIPEPSLNADIVTLPTSIVHLPGRVFQQAVALLKEGDKSVEEIKKVIADKYAYRLFDFIIVDIARASDMEFDLTGKPEWEESSSSSAESPASNSSDGTSSPLTRKIKTMKRKLDEIAEQVATLIEASARKQARRRAVRLGRRTEANKGRVSLPASILSRRTGGQRKPKGKVTFSARALAEGKERTHSSRNQGKYLGTLTDGTELESQVAAARSLERAQLKAHRLRREVLGKKPRKAKKKGHPTTGGSTLHQSVDHND